MFDLLESDPTLAVALAVVLVVALVLAVTVARGFSSTTPGDPMSPTNGNHASDSFEASRCKQALAQSLAVLEASRVEGVRLKMLLAALVDRLGGEVIIPSEVADSYQARHLDVFVGAAPEPVSAPAADGTGTDGAAVVPVAKRLIRVVLRPPQTVSRVLGPDSRPIVGLGEADRGSIEP